MAPQKATTFLRPGEIRSVNGSQQTLICSGRCNWLTICDTQAIGRSPEQGEYLYLVVGV